MWSKHSVINADWYGRIKRQHIKLYSKPPFDGYMPTGKPKLPMSTLHMTYLLRYETELVTWRLYSIVM
jgi:hypothetical protein